MKTLLATANVLFGIVLPSCSQEPAHAPCPPPDTPAPTLNCSRVSYDLRNLFETSESLGATALIAQDITGDGSIDLALLLKNKGTLAIMRGGDFGSFSLHNSFPVGSTPSALAWADIDSNGSTDALVVGHYANALTVLLGRGGGEFQKTVSYPLGNHSQQLQLADFNQDKHLDVVTMNGGSGGFSNITVLLGRGDGTFNSATPYTTSDAPMDIKVSDINSDGTPDVLVAVANNPAINVFHGKGDGTFSPPSHFVLPSNPLRFILSDVNKDSQDDLLVTHGLSSPGHLSLYLQSVTGPEKRIPLPSPVDLVAADMDEDMLVDLVVTSLEGSLFFLKGESGGTFDSSPVQMYSGSWPTSLAMTDLDRNGHLDLAWTTLSDTLEVQFNTRSCVNDDSATGLSAW
jgi:hypothetical protein